MGNIPRHINLRLLIYIIRMTIEILYLKNDAVSQRWQATKTLPSTQSRVGRVELSGRHRHVLMVWILILIKIDLVDINKSFVISAIYSVLSLDAQLLVRRLGYSNTEQYPAQCQSSPDIFTYKKKKTFYQRADCYFHCFMRVQRTRNIA